ncbi:hypothetical protein CHLNCDRAFT_27288 [Chlorella variabilis]|uniref:RING-type E3 ubiquitin transferase n=1 Tax=Chlorella variabilis TaxID=554065 RepID=E1ZQ92_CHLVA|nr:hypothetical protein CHLNCDRAFT_27288 [Chlorella variabilis]EFN51981.1 hypothetical protein CHLNCDRAFT_27288 [Chlorella variabilis]|eukprot:XP_005844083.1 hypothetical protein CHLNCDRAFT_27288 [Chlorella variabilis]
MPCPRAVLCCRIPDNQTQGFLGRVVDEVQGSRSVGVRQVERMLPVGTMLTAVGELATAGGKMLVLRAPRDGAFYLSRQPLPDVIASLQASSLACQQWAAAFTAVGASMLVAAATQHALTWVRQRRLRQRVEKAMRERAAAAAAAGGGGAAGAPAASAAEPQPADVAEAAEGGARPSLCVVCLERPCATVFPACGHMCACSRCSHGLRRCPICRSRGAPIRVYTA